LQLRCLAVAVEPADVDVLAVVDVPMVFSGVLVVASVPAVVDGSIVAVQALLFLVTMLLQVPQLLLRV